MSDPILSVARLNIRTAGRRILEDVAFCLPPVGMTVLMGPVGSGKSTLLKWLTNNADPEVYDAEYSVAAYRSQKIDGQNAPLLYPQRQEQPLEAVMVTFDRLLATSPSLICVDEPAAHMTRAEADVVMQRLGRIAQDRAVLLVTHHQEDARNNADQIMLLAGGYLQEFTPAQQFFEAPRSDAGRQFLGGGTVTTIGLDTPEHHIHPELRQLDFSPSVTSVAGNERLRAIVDGQLYLLEGAGESTSLSCEDVQALQAAGLYTVVCMEDGVHVRSGSGSMPDLNYLTVPQDDIAACKMVQAQLDAGQPVVFLRTNTTSQAAPRAVALQLVFMGLSACRAAKIAAQLLEIPGLDPSEEQELWDFEISCALEADGIDPAETQIAPPRITWAADVVARSRKSSCRR